MYFVYGLIIISLFLIIHKALKKIWRRKTKDRILENIAEITDYEKEKRKED